VIARIVDRQTTPQAASSVARPSRASEIHMSSATCHAWGQGTHFAYIAAMSVARLTLLSASLLLCLGAAACSGDVEQAADPSADDQAEVTGNVPLGNFAKVNDHLYRGGRPDAKGVAYLKSIGVRTVVSLELGDGIEAKPSVIAQEGVDVQAAGLSFRHEPITSFNPGYSAAFDGRIDAVLGIFKDPASWPIYVHCRRGKDRTGLVVGLERVLQEGWAPADAYAEWKHYGLFPIFLNLEAYFKRKTGWK
jgi:tyrosine-protein phosphatase SIW14